MRQITTIELSWNTVTEKLEEIIRRILDKSIECKVTQDDKDFWGVGFLNYRMDIPEIEKICSYVNATEEERKDAYPSENEISVGDLGVDIANKLLGMSMGIAFNKFLVEDDCLLLIDCRKSERICIFGASIFFDSLKSRNELLDLFYEHGANENTLHHFATGYTEHVNNGLFWNIPARNEKHLGAFFIIVKEGVLYLPYDDADKVSGAIFNLDAMKLANHSTAMWYLRRLQYHYSDTQDRLNDICKYLFMREKSHEEEN